MDITVIPYPEASHSYSFVLSSLSERNTKSIMSTLVLAAETKDLSSILLSIEPSSQALATKPGRYTQCTDCNTPFEICTNCDRSNHLCYSCAQRRKRESNAKRQHANREKHKDDELWRQSERTRSAIYYRINKEAIKQAREEKKQKMTSEKVATSLIEPALPAVYSGTFVLEKRILSEQSTYSPSESKSESKSESESESARQTMPVTQLIIRCLLPQEAYENLMSTLQSECFLRNACSIPSIAYGLINLPVLGQIRCQIQVCVPILPIAALTTCHICHFCGVKLPKQLRTRYLQREGRVNPLFYST